MKPLRWVAGVAVLALPLGLGTPAGQALTGASSPSRAMAAKPAVSYTYDRLGRLTSVTDQTGAQATYSYDKVGNITRIARSSGPTSAPVAPLATLPAAPRPHIAASSYASGTVVIHGSGFGHSGEDVDVRVGGLFALVRSVSPDRLVVELPPWPRSHAVEVTTPGGTARSAVAIPLHVRRTPAPPPAQGLPLLDARPGVTAVTGRVLTDSGQPLGGVSLSVGRRTTTSDATGRFLLSGISPGHHELAIDATRIRAGNHGLFEQGVDVHRGQTTKLPTTTWLPRIDEKHGIDIPAHTTHRYVVSSPAIPGLRVIVPRGTSIVDDDGTPVRHLSITKIPLNRQPFPGAPGMPLAWTLQPGDATVLGPGLRVIYPNLMHQPPGATIDYVDHDADRLGQGWGLYGHGRVSNNGRFITPDSLTRLHETYPLSVSWRWLCQLFGLCPAPGCGSQGGDPVDLGTGLFVMCKTDLAMPDVRPMALTRTYREGDTSIEPFGVGMNDSLDLFIAPYDGNGDYALGLPNGSSVEFVPNGSGVYQAVATPTEFYGATLVGNDRSWTLTLQDGTVYTFGSYTAQLESVTDRYGDTTQVERNDSTGQLEGVVSPNGRWIQVTWGSCGSGSSQCIVGAVDDIGRRVTYTYDDNARLQTVIDAAGGTTTYGWNSCDAGAMACTEITSIEDARGITFVTNKYDDNGRVQVQTEANGGTYTFAYTLGSSGVSSTLETNPRGYVRQVNLNDAGYTVSDTLAYRTGVQQRTTYTRDPDTNLVTKVVDPLGREDDYTYYANGKVDTWTENANSAKPAVITYTYEPVHQRLSSVTDPLGHKATFTYDDSAHTVTVADPLGNQTVIRMTHGEPTQITDPLGHTTVLSYLNGDLVALADPLHRQTTWFYDAAGRLRRATDPTGSRTSYSYDPLNDVTKIVDAMHGTTLLRYDANGNLVSLRDANKHSTTFTYDSMDLPHVRTDALGNTETYDYDAMGDLKSYTDANGSVTTYTYDPLNRLTHIAFGGTAGRSGTHNTITYRYDPGDRVTKAVDSIAGTIVSRYDLFDQLLSERTPQGQVSYSYDLAGRPKTTLVRGQPKISYQFNAANQLLAMTQASDKVGFSYDAADRTSAEALPNGTQEDYGYDAANEVRSIAYKHGSSTIGNLTYHYYANGLRSDIGGTLAATLLPSPVKTTTYNADNELTQLDHRTLKYDPDGQLLSDGTQTYSWDPRQELSEVAGSNTYTFGYDAYGRRISVAAGGSKTSYLYDGANVVQEQSGGKPTANLLTGLGVDQTFERATSSQTRDYLTDALGSTIALTDPSGHIATSYTYDPYGSTTQSGDLNSNTFQFTGRQNDGDGLYYNRDRYYSPALGRFISQDPMGIAGSGPDLYSYASDSPTNFTDPYGDQLIAGCVGGALVSAGIDLFGDWLNGRKTNWGDVGRDAFVGCVEGAAGAWVGRLAGDVFRSASIVGDAAEGSGFYGLGEGTAEQAAAAGRAWVGEGANLSRSGVAWKSTDGLRQYRPPVYKPRQFKWQANFESRPEPSGPWTNNGHLDVINPSAWQQAVKDGAVGAGTAGVLCLL